MTTVAAAARAMKSRGFENRNPGNIDFDPRNRWRGQIGIEPAPRNGGRPRFAVFESHEYGIRALAMLLTTYYDRHGLRTIRQIVNRWAPPNENHTHRYASFVDDMMPRHTADDRLDLHSYADMRELVVAIIKFELGGMPYEDAAIDRGLAMAGLPKPVQTLADAAATSTGRSALDMATAVGAAAPAAAVVQAMSGLPQWTGVALVLAVTGIVLLLILQRRRDRPTPAEG